MIIDCHVHVSAITPGHGVMSRKLINSLPFRFMRWRLGIEGQDARTEQDIAAKLVETVEQTEKLDAAVVLAFDAVCGDDGKIGLDRTHLYVTNDYAIQLAREHRKLLFGASVHPYRTDAIAELERCVAAGAVLMKWLPIVQGMNPADPRCFEFYDALAHHKLPLLCHTGGEKSLPRIDDALADPALLLPALQRGVTVIMAHCGTRSSPFEKDHSDTFIRMALEHEHCYGDTAALSLFNRSYVYPKLLKNPAVMRKLVHGSDWPIISLPPLRLLTLSESRGAMRECNWMRRDVLIKQMLGFDADYWHRGATVLKLPEADD